MMFLIIYMTLLLTFGPMCWALCAIASDADQQAAEEFRRMIAEEKEEGDE